MIWWFNLKTHSTHTCMPYFLCAKWASLIFLDFSFYPRREDGDLQTYIDTIFQIYADQKQTWITVATTSEAFPMWVHGWLVADIVYKWVGVRIGRGWTGTTQTPFIGWGVIWNTVKRGESTIRILCLVQEVVGEIVSIHIPAGIHCGRSTFH